MAIERLASEASAKEAEYKQEVRVLPYSLRAMCMRAIVCVRAEPPFAEPICRAYHTPVSVDILILVFGLYMLR